MWTSGFSEVGPVEEILEPFVSQECDMFRMSGSAEKPFTKALCPSDRREVFSMNIDGTDTEVDIRTYSKTNDGVMESIDHIIRTVKGRSMGYGGSEGILVPCAIPMVSDHSYPPSRNGMVTILHVSMV